jgi:predicted RNA methylase
MSKLTKLQAAAHDQCEAFLAKDTLTDEDRFYVLEHWQESARNVNSAAGAFFTPYGLAADMALELSNLRGTVRVLDLCAGAGTLGLAVLRKNAWQIESGDLHLEIVCVETNPEYVRVGRKILPEATWIESSIFDLPDLGHFDVAMSNPPFGRVKRDGDAPRYTGAEFEYHVLDIAAHRADVGVFILPQQSVPFRYSGQPCYREESVLKHDRFVKQTGIRLEAGCGVDTSIYRDAWHGVSPKVEIATCDFDPAEVTPVEVADQCAAPPLPNGATVRTVAVDFENIPAFEDVPLFELEPTT